MLITAWISHNEINILKSIKNKKLAIQFIIICVGNLRHQKEGKKQTQDLILCINGLKVGNKFGIYFGCPTITYALFRLDVWNIIARYFFFLFC